MTRKFIGRGFIFILINTCLILLTGCDDTPDDKLVKVSCDECIVDIESFKYDDVNLILGNEELTLSLQTLAQNICNYINENDGVSLSISRPSYNFWGFQMSTKTITIGVTVYSSNIENTRHSMIITYIQDDEILDSLTFYYDEAELNEFIQELNN